MLQRLDTAQLNLLKMADYLDALDADDFDMASCSDCIAGHIGRAFGVPVKSAWVNLKAQAAELFGLDEDTARELMEPKGIIHEDAVLVSPREAACIMRHLAVTGEVLWG
jgi:hypothetical protein